MSKSSTVLLRPCSNILPFFYEIWITSCKEKYSLPMGQCKSPLKTLLIPVRMVFLVDQRTTHDMAKVHR
jgi:hypothetical protein